MIEGQAEAIGNALLHGMHFGAELFHRLAGLGGGQFGRGAVFIGGAKEQHLMPAPAHETRVKVGGQLRSHQVAQVLDSVDIRDGRGDQNPGHARAFL